MATKSERIVDAAAAAAQGAGTVHGQTWPDVAARFESAIRVTCGQRWDAPFPLRAVGYTHGVRFAYVSLTCLCLGALGCSSGSASGPAPAPQPADSVSAITLAAATPLSLQPGESVSLSFTVSPPQAVEVIASLEGSFGDGALSSSRLESNEQGAGSLTLYAPTSPATYQLKLRSAGKELITEVQVAGAGFGTLKVRPNYVGNRQISQWVASAHLGKSCADLAMEPFADGSPVVSAPADATALLLSALPVGSSVAVNLRGDGLVQGCTTVSDLAPTDVRSVVVSLQDVPADGSGTALKLEGHLSVNASPWQKIGKAWAERVETAFYGSVGGSAEAALLDAMAQEVPANDAASFVQARAQEGWETKLAQSLPVAGLNLLRTTWLPRARFDLGQTKGFGFASLEFRANGGSPSLIIKSLFGQNPSQSSLPASAAVSQWTIAGDEDTASLAADVSFQPLELMAAALTAVIKRPPYSSLSIGGALSAVTQCNAVAGLLAPSSGPVFATCDQSCAALVCEQALVRMWKQVEQAEMVNMINGKLEMQISGEAVLSADAKVQSITSAQLSAKITDTSLAGAGENALSGKLSISPL